MMTSRLISVAVLTDDDRNSTANNNKHNFDAIARLGIKGDWEALGRWNCGEESINIHFNPKLQSQELQAPRSQTLNPNPSSTYSRKARSSWCRRLPQRHGISPGRGVLLKRLGLSLALSIARMVMF